MFNYFIEMMSNNVSGAVGYNSEVSHLNLTHHHKL